MEGDWSPAGDDHEETIYYISRYILRFVHNRALDQREILANVYRLLEDQASVSNAKEVAASLPIGRVKHAEVVSLFYASQTFYEVMCSVEAVFDQLLSEDNVYLFGVFLVADVSHYLGKVDIGLI